MASSNFITIIKDISDILKKGDIKLAIEQTAASIKSFYNVLETTGEKEVAQSFSAIELNISLLGKAIGLVETEISKLSEKNKLPLTTGIRQLNEELSKTILLFSGKSGLSAFNDIGMLSENQYLATVLRAQQRLLALQKEFHEIKTEFASTPGIGTYEDAAAEELGISGAGLTLIQEAIDKVKLYGETFSETSKRVKREFANEASRYDLEEKRMPWVKIPGEPTDRDKEYRAAITLVKKLEDAGNSTAESLQALSTIQNELANDPNGIKAAILYEQIITKWQQRLNDVAKADENVQQKRLAYNKLTRDLAKSEEEVYSLLEAIKALEDPKGDSLDDRLGVSFSKAKITDINKQIARTKEDIAELPAKWRAANVSIEEAEQSVKNYLKTVKSYQASPEEQLTPQGVARRTRDIANMNAVLRESLIAYNRFKKATDEVSVSTKKQETLYDRLIANEVKIANSSEARLAIYKEMGVVFEDFESNTEVYAKAEKLAKEKIASIQKEQDEKIKILQAGKDEILLLEKLRQKYVELETKKRFEGVATRQNMQTTAAMLAEEARTGKGAYITDSEIARMATRNGLAVDYNKATALAKEYIDNMSAATAKEKQEVFTLRDAYNKLAKDITTNLAAAYANVNSGTATVAQTKLVITDLKYRADTEVDIDRQATMTRIKYLEELLAVKKRTASEAYEATTIRKSKDLQDLYNQSIAKTSAELTTLIAENKKERAVLEDKKGVNKEYYQDLTSQARIYGLALKNVRDFEKSLKGVQVADSLEALRNGATLTDDALHKVLKLLATKRSLTTDRAEINALDAEILKYKEVLAVQTKTKEERRQAKLEALATVRAFGDAMYANEQAAIAYRGGDKDALTRQMDELNTAIIARQDALKGLHTTTALSKEDAAKYRKELDALKAAKTKILVANKELIKSEAEAEATQRRSTRTLSDLKRDLQALAGVVKRGAISFDEAEKQFSELKKELATFNMRDQKAVASELNTVTRGIAHYNNVMSTTLKGWDKIKDTVGTRFGYFLTSGVMIFRALQMVGQGIRAVAEYTLAYEKSLANLNAIVAPTAREFVKLDAAIRTASLGTTQSIAEVADAATALGKLGYSASQITDMIGPVTLFTQATMESTDAVAELLGATIKIFDLSFKDSAKVLDLFAASMNKTAISFSYLQTSMKIVGPVAKAVNLSLEDTTAYLGVLANSGLDASRGATALRNILLHLADPASKLSKHLGFVSKNADDVKRAFEILNSSTYMLGDTLELTDKRSVAAFNRMMASTVEMNKLAKELQNVSGTLKEMREKQLEATTNSFNALTTSAKNFLAAFTSTGGIGKFFTRLRQDIDAITKNYISMRGADATEGAFGVTGYMPNVKVKEPKFWDKVMAGLSSVPSLFYSKKPSALSIMGKAKRQMDESAIAEEKTWDQYYNKYVENKISTPTKVIEAMRKATADNYLKVFTEVTKLSPKQAEEILKKSPAYERNKNLGPQVLAEQLIAGYVQEVLNDTGEQLQQDMKLITDVVIKAGGHVNNMINKETGELAKDKVLQEFKNVGDKVNKRYDADNLTLIGKAVSRIFASTSIEDELNKLSPTLDKPIASVESASSTGESAIERWKKFLEKVKSEEQKAIEQQKVNILKDESKYYEMVAKDADNLSNVRIAASEKWYTKEVELINASLTNDKVANQEKARMDYLTAKGWSSMNKAQEEEFLTWYDTNYVEAINSIENKYYNEYLETFQSVMKTRVDIIQQTYAKEEAIREKQLTGDLNAIRARLEAREEEAKLNLELATREKESGMGFLLFTEAEKTVMAYESERLVVSEQLNAAKEEENRIYDELMNRQAMLNKLMKSEVMSREDVNGLVANLKQALDTGAISAKTHNNILDMISGSLAKGAMSQEDYNKAIESLKQELAAAGLEVAKLQGVLNALQPPTFKGDWGQNMTAGQAANLERFKTISSAALNYFNSVSDVVTGFYDVQLEKMQTAYDKETELLEKKYAEEEELIKLREDTIKESRDAGLLSAEEADAQERLLAEQREAREKQIEREKEARELAYNKRKNAIEVKAAKWKKAQSLLEIGQKTAIAIMNASALPIPFNAIAIAAASALGAAQAALVAAQPIPTYAMGTNSHPGGLAIVGDGGKQEVIQVGNKAYLTPATSTLVDMPRGAKVKADISEYALSRLARIDTTGFNKEDTLLFDAVLHSLTETGNVELNRINKTLGSMRATERFLVQESMRKVLTAKYK